MWPFLVACLLVVNAIYTEEELLGLPPPLVPIVEEFKTLGKEIEDYDYQLAHRHAISFCRKRDNGMNDKQRLTSECTWEEYYQVCAIC
jgi:hypothetical protein